jgi:hypothetical protein
MLFEKYCIRCLIDQPAYEDAFGWREYTRRRRWIFMISEVDQDLPNRSCEVPGSRDVRRSETSSPIARYRNNSAGSEGRHLLIRSRRLRHSLRKSCPRHGTNAPAAIVLQDSLHIILCIRHNADFTLDRDL